jgi:hypothetical protein
LAIDLPHQPVDDLGDVARTLAQGRQLNRDDRQAIVQVFTELAVLDGLKQITVGSGQNADVAPSVVGIPDAAEHTAARTGLGGWLRHPQQLGLHRDIAL